MRQSTAVKVLAAGKNVFLTGAPGAGKTHLLNRFITYLKKRDVPHAITAPTGIAATHIGGSTLHSWSGLGIQDTVNEKVIERLLGKSYLKKRFEQTKVLIIDEVSMLTPGLFQAVNEILQNVRFSTEPFGGVQVVLTGDFFQLPPVSPEQTANPRFVWQTELWKELDPSICYLSERHRHSDEDFIRLLDEMRTGEVSELSFETLQKCMESPLPDHIEPTRLYTHNIDVDRINTQELEKINKPTRVYTARTEGNPKLTEKLLDSSLLMEDLEIKEGALVMFIKNNFEKGFVNGTLGKITRFDEDTNYPFVLTTDGEEILAEPEEWNITSESGTKLAKVTQVPLRLAWAITVHKSQGMTLDAAEIDLSKAFEPGHGYVALSRVRDLSGLRLLGMNDMALRVHPKVLEEDYNMQKVSYEVEREFHEKPVEEKYPPLTEAQEQKRQERFQPKVPTIEKTRRLLEKGLSLEEIAEEREVTVGTIIKHVGDLKELGVLKISLDHLLPENAEEILDLVEAVKKRENPEELTEKGDVRLGAIFREGKEKYSYDEIKLVMALA